MKDVQIMRLAGRVQVVAGVAGAARSATLGVRLLPIPYQAEWRAVRDGDPADWARACEVDDALRMDSSVVTRGATDKLFCHRSCGPLREADLGAEGNDDQLEFEFARE